MARILHIIPYHKFFPPQNGGALRCFHLLKSLASCNDVDLITFQDKRELISEGNYVFPANVNVFNPVDFNKSNSLIKILPRRIVDAVMFRYLTGSLKGPTDSTLLNIYPILNSILLKNKYDIVIFEHLQSMLAARYIRKISPSTKLILDAHNVDHILLEKELKYQNKAEKHKNLIVRLKNIESSLNNYVDGYLTCSSHDENILIKLNHENLLSLVVPNGVDVENKPFHKNKLPSATILFCGDLTTAANKDGLLWFYSDILLNILKKIPEINLIVVGPGSEDVDFSFMKRNKNVTFVGKVDNVVKYYHNSFVSVAPLRIGSGTRLKILEAMSLGNPVVATGIGAEGVNYPAKSIFITDNTDCFASNIIELIQNPEMAEKQRQLARSFVEKEYSWSKIGLELNKFIQKLLYN